MKKKLFIRYWKGTPFSVFRWTNGQECPIDNMYDILWTITEEGYNSMILNYDEAITIFINDGRFTQS